MYHTATLQFVMTKYVLLNGLTTALLMDGALLGIILAGRVQVVKMLIRYILITFCILIYCNIIQPMVCKMLAEFHLESFQPIVFKCKCS